ncbi:hypothetical protein [Paracoccus sp. PAMC 22219]
MGDLTTGSAKFRDFVGTHAGAGIDPAGPSGSMSRAACCPRSAAA